MQPQKFLHYHENHSEIDSEFQNVADQRIVDIINWRQINGDKVSPFIREWASEDISFDECRYPLLLKEISHISFPKLKFLVLIFNEITSVQGISRIRMPVLEQIYLNDNLIFCIKDLRKAYFPELIALSLCASKVQDGKMLDQMDLGKLKSLLIEWSLDEVDDEASCHDVRWVIKLKTKELGKFAIKNKERVKQTMFEKVLRKRQKEIEINPEEWFVQN